MFNIVDEYDPQNNSYPPPHKRKHTGLKILIIIVLTLVMIFGITVLGYYTFLPAKYTLLAAGYSSAIKSYSMFDKNLAQYENKYLNPFLEDTIKKETKMGISADENLLEQFLPAESVEEVIKAINSISLRYDSAFDYKNKKQTMRLGLNYLLNPIITTRFSLNDTKFTIGVDELSKKTIIGDFKSLGSLSRFSPDTPSETWEALESINPWIFARIIEEVKFNRQDVKNLMSDYSKEIIRNIDSSDMTIKRGVSEDVLDKAVKCQEITISLSAENQKKIALNVVDMLKTDDSFYNLTFGNLEKCCKILEESTYMGRILNESRLSDNLSKDKYPEYLSQLEEEIIASEDETDIEIKIYIDGLDIVKYKVTSKSPSDSDDTVIILEQRIKGQSFDYRLSTDSDSEDKAANMVMAIKRDYDASNDLNDIFIKLDIAESILENPFKSSITIDSSEEKSDSREVKHTVDLELKYEQETPDGTDKGAVKLSLDGDKYKNTDNLVTESDYKGKLSMSVPSEGLDNMEIGFYTKTETIYGEEVTIPEPKDSIDIKTATEEDFNRLSEEIISNIGTLTQLTGEL